MIVLSTTVVAWVTSLGVTTAVVDTTTVDPCDVTTDDSVVVMTDGSVLGGAEVVGGVADVVADVDPDVVRPVDKLTCRFSSLARAASISRAGTADAEMMAKRSTVENDHGCIVKIVAE